MAGIHQRAKHRHLAIGKRACSSGNTIIFGNHMACPPACRRVWHKVDLCLVCIAQRADTKRGSRRLTFGNTVIVNAFGQFPATAGMDHQKGVTGRQGIQII